MLFHATPPLPRPRRFTASLPVRTFVSAAAFIIFATTAHSQGCVAIKQMGDAACGLEQHSAERWELSVSYEHFRSFRHFVGTDEQEQRVAAGSEVINVVEQVDVALDYKLNSRTTLSLGVPYFYASRTSLYEHDRVNRFKMHGKGVGDVRMSVTRWLRDPVVMPKNNFAFTLGLKLPTGNTNVKDYAHTANGLVLRNVDQSIQPGDGGWGIALGAQAFQQLTDTTTVYASAFYLLNPQEMNGTRTTSGITSATAYNSIADQYQARLGLSRQFQAKHAITGSIGLLWEGVPSSDLIGGDAGFRRPGYVLSLEPGIAFNVTPRDAFSISVPVALVRNRVRSYVDKLNGRHGDAAFADFLINIGYSRKW